MTARAEAVAFYREANRRHRTDELLHMVNNRPLHAAKERAAVNWVDRAIRAEQKNPKPEPRT